MKSDLIIHEIVADYGDEELRKRLKVLRHQVKSEVIKVFDNSMRYTKLLYK